MEDKKMTIVMMEVGKESKVIETPSTLKDMQNLVQGYIEAIYPFDDNACLICNDEGKFNGMKANRTLYGQGKEIIDVIYGPFFVCGCDKENFTSLTSEQCRKYEQLFKTPEKIMCLGGKATMVPCPEVKAMER